MFTQIYSVQYYSYPTLPKRSYSRRVRAEVFPSRSTKAASEFFLATGSQNVYHQTDNRGNINKFLFYANV